MRTQIFFERHYIIVGSRLDDCEENKKTHKIIKDESKICKENNQAKWKKKANIFCKMM